MPSILSRRNKNDIGSSSHTLGANSNSDLLPAVPDSSVPQLPPTPSGGDRGTALSGGEYARKCQKLMNLLRHLRELGADAVFDLPKIVVIGNQSAGKSSLIEAVTGITVPRDSSTCTRCPMECSMSSAATSWSCTISLRSEITTDTSAESPRSEVSLSPSSPASVFETSITIPCVYTEVEALSRTPTPAPHTTTQQFGDPITDKTQVEVWLRRAQGAILSRDPNKQKWLTKSADEIKQAIENRTNMVEFTEDTIVVNIRDPHATDLLFVDLPGIIANADDNSVELIKDVIRYNIVGKNTLILVTIPANDDIDNHGAVMLAKEADPSGDRTIVVITKPDKIGDGDTGLQQTWRQMLENRNVASNRHYLQHGYYGVRLPNDVERVQGHTARSLPNDRNATKPWCDFADRGRFGVSNLVRDISALLVQMIEANLPGLRAAIEVASKQCLDRLSKLPPVVSHENEMASIMLLINAFLREIETASFGEKHKTLAQTCRGRYSKLRDEIEGTCPKFERNKSGWGVIYDLQEVKTVINDCTGWELPGVIPYDVYKTFIKRFLKRWKEPVEKCFEDVYDTFSSFVVKLSDSHFSSFPHLSAFVLQKVRSELQKSRITTEASVLKLLDIEAQSYFSQRTVFRVEQEKWMKHYWNKFHPHEHPDRHYELKEEIHVMATVRAYFQFSFERFTDMLLLTQEHDLVQSLRSKLEVTLLNEVSTLSANSDNLKRLLAEDENIERERKELTRKSKAIANMRNELDAYGTL